MSQKIALMWFRNDLRLQDNTAWSAAAASGVPVAAVYLFCEQQLVGQHDVGPARLDFNARNLACLQACLEKQGVPLFFLDAKDFSGVPKQLQQLCRELSVATLYCNEEYAWNERERDEQVRLALGEQGVELEKCPDQVVLAPGTVCKNDGDYYQVFTPFRRAWTQTLQAQDYAPRKAGEAAAAQVSKLPSGALPKAEVEVRLRAHRGASSVDLFPAGEPEAARRLERFIAEQVEDYKQLRDFPARPGTSVLSPYLSAGVISIRACLRAALQANQGELNTGNDGILTWISELIWREFYRSVLVGFPWVNKHLPFKRDTASVPWRQDESEFARWCEGKTGYPLVDAAQRQLNETGWMHNRLRMVSAMFLTKHLLMDWRWGERYFMQKLVDGDFASNNGGWQWSASTGTDAQPYFRIFNPVTQSEKFDASGDFIRQFVPEIRERKGKLIHAALEEGDAPGEDYPAAIVDHRFARERALTAFKTSRQ